MASQTITDNKAINGSIEADIEAVARIDAVPSILEIACRITGLRFAAVARVTDTNWIACAVRDEISFGLNVGGELPLETTICDEIRLSHTGVIIDHVSKDATFCDHHTPKRYGFESYISIPIIKRDGSFFGTLCALDPLPAKLSEPGISATFQNFAKLIGLQLDVQDELARKDAELAHAGRSAGIRERFIAILGHDLRNPVAAIGAGASMLRRMDLPPKGNMILDQMNQSTQRIVHLVDDLLDFARGRMGSGLALHIETSHRLDAALHAVIDELRVIYPNREIEVDIKLDEPVSCDVERITQLLSNLLGNALKHGTADRPVQVRGESRDGRLALSVANAGSPISPELLPVLFEPFTRAEHDVSSSGLGLGLFIASEIAKAHGGTLEVASGEVETRFQLIMPCAVSC